MKITKNVTVIGQCVFLLLLSVRSGRLLHLNFKAIQKKNVLLLEILNL